MDSYVKYQKIKNIFNIVHRGYAINQLLGLSFAKESYFSPKRESLLKLLLMFIRIRVVKFNVEFEDNDILLRKPYGYSRKDYIEFVDLVAQSLPNHKYIEHLNKPRLFFKPLLILKTYLEVRKRISENIFIAKSFRDILYYTAIIFQAKVRIDELEFELDKRKRPKCFVAVNSSITNDAYHCLAFRKLGVKTYSLQHGFYTLYKDFIPMDIINYENFTADYMLCWGESSQKNMEKFGINKDRLLIAGNPRMNKYPVFQKPKFKSCLVLLGRSVYHRSNVELIKLLSEITIISNEKFYVKPHPSVKKYENEYKKHFSNSIFWINEDKTVLEMIDSKKYDFYICNNTSSYFEVFSKGYICLRYAKYENEKFKSISDKFHNLITYNQIKEKFSKLSQDDLNTSGINSLKKHFAPDSQLKYNKILNK